MSFWDILKDEQQIIFLRNFFCEDSFTKEKECRIINKTFQICSVSRHIKNHTTTPCVYIAPVS